MCKLAHTYLTHYHTHNNNNNNNNIIIIIINSGCRICIDAAETFHEQFRCVGATHDLAAYRSEQEEQQQAAEQQGNMRGCAEPAFVCSSPRNSVEVRAACEQLHTQLLYEEPQWNARIWESMMLNGDAYTACANIGKCEADTPPPSSSTSLQLNKTNCHVLLDQDKCRFGGLTACPALLEECAPACFLCAMLAQSWPLFDETCKPAGAKIVERSYTTPEAVAEAKEEQEEEAATAAGANAPASAPRAKKTATAKPATTTKKKKKSSGSAKPVLIESQPKQQQQQQPVAPEMVALPRLHGQYPSLLSTTTTPPPPPRGSSSVALPERADRVLSKWMRRAKTLSPEPHHSAASTAAQVLRKYQRQQQLRRRFSLLESLQPKPSSSTSRRLLKLETTNSSSSSAAAPSEDSLQLSRQCMAEWEFMRTDLRARYYVSFKKLVSAMDDLADAYTSQRWDATTVCQCLGRCPTTGYQRLSRLAACDFAAHAEEAKRLVFNKYALVFE
jgi:hypothetical protein